MKASDQNTFNTRAPAHCPGPLTLKTCGGMDAIWISAEFSVGRARLFRASRGQSIIYPRLNLRHLDNAAQPLSSGGGLARVRLRVPPRVPRILNRVTKAPQRYAAQSSARIIFRLAYRVSSLIPPHSPPCNTKTRGRDEGRGRLPSGAPGSCAAARGSAAPARALRRATRVSMICKE